MDKHLNRCRSPICICDLQDILSSLTPLPIFLQFLLNKSFTKFCEVTNEKVISGNSLKRPSPGQIMCLGTLLSKWTVKTLIWYIIPSEYHIPWLLGI